MEGFVQRHKDVVIGQLNGFDRIRLRGTKRLLSVAGGMMYFLWSIRVLLKDWKVYVTDLTQRLRQATEQLARQAGRPLLYLPKPTICKEQVARELAQRDRVEKGLICILSSVEPCQTYDLHRNREKRELELRPAWRKCLHYYHYWRDERWGFLQARLQSWMPLTLHVNLNGREWLARQLDRAGIGYVRRDNCFVDLADVPAAQRLLDEQLRTDWPPLLNAVARRVLPVENEILRGHPVDYYWSADETEWASDVMFRSAGDLETLYPTLIHHGMTALGSRDVMRFLGRRVPATGGVSGSFRGEVVTDLRTRPEGIRIKHRLNHNALKMYNKQGSVLRVETTINQPAEFRTYRPAEGQEQGPREWRPMRKGVVDLPARAAVSQAANDRYLEAMAAVEARQPLGELSAPLCRPVRWKRRRQRALNPLAPEDAALLGAVSRGEFVLHGFRNRDLREALYGPAPSETTQHRRQSGKVTRLIRLLRAHHLVRKLSHTHRYQLTRAGRIAISTLLLARQADATKFAQAA